MTDIVLWSGGLDSTWTLWKLLARPRVVALSVRLETSDGPLRQNLEANARARLKPHLAGVQFLDASMNIASTDVPNKDTANCLYIAAQFAMGLRMGPSDTIWMGANADDDGCTGDGDARWDAQRIVWNHLLKAAYQIGDPPRIDWISPAPTRAQQIADLGDLSKLTWSCRDPQPGECGKCTPCRFIHSARGLNQ